MTVDLHSAFLQPQPRPAVVIGGDGDGGTRK
jgi:hypothetical protein